MNNNKAQEAMDIEDENQENEKINLNSISTLEQCGSWLLSIPRDNVRLLQSTPEYKNFLLAFERLGHAHRYQINLHQQSSNLNGNSIYYNNQYTGYNRISNSYSFLQHLVGDDIIMRIFEFLECHTLIQLTTTCHRFCTLSLRSADQRTQHFFEPTSFRYKKSCNGRCNSGCSVSTSSKAPCFCHYRTTVMQLARAKEQILGIRPSKPPFVSVPMWGLPRRIEVTQSGDIEYNGIYFCTGTNGNGFIFTKPRIIHSFSDSPLFLRCIISKRFSNDNILWYMSKEMTITENMNTANRNRFDLDITNTNNALLNSMNHEKEQIFSFWAELMRSGEASSDVCRYPSQSSVLSRNGDPGWQSLENTADIHPPIVELLD